MQQTSIFRVVIELDSVRKALVLNKEEIKEIQPLVQKLFSLEVPFQVVIKSLKAIVTSTSEVFSDDELEVELLAINNNEQMSGSNADSESLSDNGEQLLVETDINEIKNKVFANISLLEDLNLWANQKNFFLYFPNGPRSQKDGIIRNVGCNFPGCKFRLYLISLSNKNKENIKENSKEEIKYQLESFKNKHNHEFKETKKEQFTPEIIKAIDSIKGKMKTISDKRSYQSKF